MTAKIYWRCLGVCGVFGASTLMTRTTNQMPK